MKKINVYIIMIISINKRNYCVNTYTQYMQLLYVSDPNTQAY